MFEISDHQIYWISAHSPEDMERVLEYKNCIRVRIDHFYAKDQIRGLINLHPKWDYYPKHMEPLYSTFHLPDLQGVVLSTEPMFRDYAIITCEPQHILKYKVMLG